MKLDDLSLYCALMDDITRRVAVARKFACGALAEHGEDIAIESACLQLRKILELIALGSLVANKKEFSQHEAKIRKYYHANRILRDIERINKGFYPTPQVIQRSEGSGVAYHCVPRKDGYLTKKRFEKVYEKCGGILHASNPLGSRIDYAYFKKNVLTWIQEVQNLLNEHSIRLLNNPDVYLIRMKCPSLGTARGHVLGPLVKGQS